MMGTMTRVMAVTVMAVMVGKEVMVVTMRI